MMKELHPLEFFLPSNARLLMLGSFPPPRNRWSMDFFYPNLQNDMWRIFGFLFFEDRNYFVDSFKKSFKEPAIRLFLQEKGIALGDTAKEVIRLKENASDRFLEMVRLVDLNAVLSKIPLCTTIVATGQKATDALLTMLSAPEPKIGGCSETIFEGRALRIYRMPSSSRAYPLPLERKAELYCRMFQEVGIL